MQHSLIPASGEAMAIAAAAPATERLIDQWLHGRSPHTQRSYRAAARRFLAFVAAPLDRVTLADLQAWADQLGADDLAPATRAQQLAAVKSLCTFGHRLGVLGVNVGAALRLPPLRNELAARILSEADVHRLLALETNPRNHALLRLAYAAGLRAAELCGLRWLDLGERSEGGQVTVFGKGSKTRAVLLPAGVWDELVSLRGAAGPNEPVFRSRKLACAHAGHLGPWQVRQIVLRAARRAGIEAAVSPHWLRHAHASHALDRGAPIHLVQQTLGHASVATTGRYLHARPTDSSARYLAA